MVVVVVVVVIVVVEVVVVAVLVVVVVVVVVVTVVGAVVEVVASSFVDNSTSGRMQSQLEPIKTTIFLKCASVFLYIYKNTNQKFSRLHFQSLFHLLLQ